MAEYSKLASGHFVSTGGTQMVNLPFQPDYVELTNWSVANATPTNNGVFSAKWWSDMGQGTAVEEVYALTATSPSVTALTADTVTSYGISTFSAGIMLQYGVKQQVIAATKGTTTSFNVAAHGYAVGDIVQFEGLYQTSTTGMPQIAGMSFAVLTVTDANNFIIDWNSNNAAYTALSGSPAGATVRKVLYPFLYAPGAVTIAAIALGATTTVTTTAPSNFVQGQEVAFHIPANWGTTQLNSLPNPLIPGQPVYGYVTSVTNSLTFVVNINSSAYTAFTTNVPVANVPGLTFPQVVAVGDVNTGGWPYTGGALYPSPVVNGFPTINGPAIQGAFVNNTSQGFVVGVGAGTNQTSSVLVGAAGNIIYWRALLHDLTL